MKNNIGGRFYTQVITNILYSTMVACLIEVFLITNIDMLVTYLVESGNRMTLFTGIFRMGTVTTILYVLFGIAVFYYRRV